MFRKCEPGVVKVVVATNIAETSITIPEVVAVIDAGLHKEMRYSASAGVRALTPARITQASAAQRAGRAGRVRPGVCYHLFMHAELNSMAEFPTPEVLQCELEPLCLRLLANRLLALAATAAGGGGGAATATAAATATGGGRCGSGVVDETVRLLSELIDPPRSADVQRAIVRLRALGALHNKDAGDDPDRPTEDASSAAVGGGGGGSGDSRRRRRGEELSVLGRTLSQMPTDLWVAKLLLYGAVLCALTPVCVIAASVSATVSLWPAREEARARRGLDPSSDFMAALRAWQAWSRLRQHTVAGADGTSSNGNGNGDADADGGDSRQRQAEAEFCERHGLSSGGLEALDSEATRLRGEVLAALPRLTAAKADAYAGNTGLVRAALVAALGTNLAQAVAGEYSANPTRLLYHFPLDSWSTADDAEPAEADAAGRQEGQAAVHPSSGLHGTRMALVTPEKSTAVLKPYVLYSSVVKTSRVFLSGVSVISPLLAAVFTEHLAPLSQADSEAVAAGLSSDKNRFSFAGLGGEKKLAIGGADEVTLTLGKSSRVLRRRLRLRNAHAQLLLKLRAAIKLVVDSSLTHYNTRRQPRGAEAPCTELGGTSVVVSALAGLAEQLFAAPWETPAGWDAKLDPTVPQQAQDFCTAWLYTNEAMGIEKAERPKQQQQKPTTTAVVLQRRGAQQAQPQPLHPLLTLRGR